MHKAVLPVAVLRQEMPSFERLLTCLDSLGFPPCLQMHKAEKKNTVEIFESSVGKIPHDLNDHYLKSEENIFFSPKCVILACP